MGKQGHILVSVCIAVTTPRRLPRPYWLEQNTVHTVAPQLRHQGQTKSQIQYCGDNVSH